MNKKLKFLTFSGIHKGLQNYLKPEVSLKEGTGAARNIAIRIYK